MQWKNWSGRQRASLESLVFVRSEADASAVVSQCAQAGKTIRVAGAGHSHAPVVTNDSIIVDSSGLSGLLEVDRQAREAWVRAGTSIYSLGGQLHDHGLALKNQGDIDRQLLGGAIATGTHGTGRNLQNISASVTGLRIILANGEQVECSNSELPELFNIARLSVGSAGLITRIRMKLEESAVLSEQIHVASYDDTINRITALIAENDRFEFFWYPGSDEANIKTINPAATEPEYPLAKEGARVAWSYEVLPNHRPHLHTEMEYSVPAANGPACFAEIRQLIHRQFPDVQWPVEYRTVAADDIWLSMASDRDTVTISVHQDIKLDEEPYYRACEEVFLAYGGRPHWGKVNYLNGDDFARIYPRWHDWWRVRDQYDPGGVFLNDYARGLRPSSL
ncbi:MAG: FAD-binding protein [Gammaproteobacteria bacterium]|nr:FAD-binding protein [Gammaproteobacteria bacterium]MBT3869722.1 FAD-binding protein [Gammaproteobacteria bacterium]MBT4377655.1 FAD-binding protein [Gammaproteobacteria bacterium]MBT4618367.1 FAD-binding protein [Gammaproteobacteria bacterium]MBT5197627.1 FAD-binding protein [Gammaproteobacteria bacterium]